MKFNEIIMIVFMTTISLFLSVIFSPVIEKLVYEEKEKKGS
jgi:hypothetical protein